MLSSINFYMAYVFGLKAKLLVGLFEVGLNKSGRVGIRSYYCFHAYRSTHNIR